MRTRTIRHFFVAAMLFTACDALRDALPDVTLGAKEGIPAVAGSTTVALPTGYTCGAAITDPNGKYTVTSSGTQDACTLSFSQTFSVLTAADYANKPALAGATLIKSVDFDVSRLAVTNAATGAALDPTTVLLDLNGSALGASLFTKADLTRPTPFHKSIGGAAVDGLKAKVQAKQPIDIPIVVMVKVKLAPTPPSQIGLVFDAQPSLVFGF